MDSVTVAKCIMTAKIIKANVFILSCLCLVACHTQISATSVNYEQVDRIDDFLKYIEYIDVVPLQNDGEHYIGANPELLVSEDSYIVADMFNMHIYRYSKEGNYLNQIGMKGNGPAEFLTIDNIQLLPDGILNVFSQSGKVISYDIAGDFVAETLLEDYGGQGYYVDNGYLVYYGDGVGRDYRISLDKGKSRKTFLTATDNVLHYTSDSPVFSLNYDESISIVDSYSPVIYRYSNGQVSEYLEFDFNETAVPSEYYEQESPFAAADLLLTRDFSIIRRYFENEEYKFVEIFTNHPTSMPTFTYGMSYGDQWFWFATGRVDEKPLTASFRTIDADNVLYAIIDPMLLDDCQPEILKLIRERSKLEMINHDDNYLIFKIKLKSQIK